jgi:hypothetical protein
MLPLYTESGSAGPGCTLVPLSRGPRPPKHEIPGGTGSTPELVPHPGLRYPGVPRGTPRASPGYPGVPRGTPGHPEVPPELPRVIPGYSEVNTEAPRGTPGYLGIPRGTPGYPSTPGPNRGLVEAQLPSLAARKEMPSLADAHSGIRPATCLPGYPGVVGGVRNKL